MPHTEIMVHPRVLPLLRPNPASVVPIPFALALCIRLLDLGARLVGGPHGTDVERRALRQRQGDPPANDPCAARQPVIAGCRDDAPIQFHAARLAAEAMTEQTHQLGPAHRGKRVRISLPRLPSVATRDLSVLRALRRCRLIAHRGARFGRRSREVMSTSPEGRAPRPSDRGSDR